VRISSSSITSENGSCPEEQAAHQMRMLQLRHDDIAEMVEGLAIAEEEGLVGCQSVDDALLQSAVSGLDPAQEIVEAGDILLAQNRREASLDEIGLLRREHDAGRVLDEFDRLLDRMDAHAAFPSTRDCASSPSFSGGNWAAARPASAMLPGMPQTTLEGSSCTMTLAPRWIRSCAPPVPSLPMPVSAIASVSAPKQSAALVKSRSIEGRQGPRASEGSMVRIICPSGWRRITVWQPPGAR
jgi:hypothetical protein